MADLTWSAVPAVLSGTLLLILSGESGLLVISTAISGLA
jgi:hypothetical protein